VAFDPATGRIYWANDGGNKISFANLNGSGGGDLTTTGATMNQPIGVAIDPAAGRIYWGNTGGVTKVSYANLDGTGGGDVATGVATVNQPAGVAVDPAAGRIYWANVAGNKISFAYLNGSGGGDLFTGVATVSAPVGVAVDTAAGRIYWANQGGNKISFANLNGSGGGDLATTGATVNTPTGVAIDPAAGRIYWGNFLSSSISYANLDGSGGADLPTAGATSNHSVFPVLLQAPRGAGVPVISGGTVVGATLSCTQGSWAPGLVASFDYRAPQSFAYGWSNSGTPIVGATSSSITASSPGSYSCQVTASNQTGATAQSSAAFTVTATSPPPPVTPVVALPSLGRLSVSPHSLRAASSGASITAKKTGATVSYTDSQASTTTLTVLKITKGFTRNGRCVAKRPTGQKHAKRCTLYRPIGSFRHMDKAGSNRFHFSGRIRGKKLKPGAYRLKAIPTFAGRSGAAHTTGFQVVL
jgi:DNA-binding beta-propeller fold protein YncE